MVFTKISSIDKYASLHPSFKMAFDALRKYASPDTPEGKYVIDGDNLFVNVQAYETEMPDKIQYEGHCRYIDIQYVISGNEDIKVMNIDDSDVTKEYDPENDYALYAPLGAESTCELSAGDLLILFPEDLHAPGLAHKAPSYVQKIVVKVKI